MTEGEEFHFFCRRFVNGDELALIQLVENGFPNFLNGNFWVWKYRKNLDFDPSLIVVAEKDGEVVGCNHWLVRDLKLSSSLKVRTALGSDIVVHPKHRGKGVGKQLLRFLRLRGDYRNKGIILNYMFADPKLSKRLYGPTLGYVLAPNSTTTYKKLLNLRNLKERIRKLNRSIESKKELQRKLKGLKISVLFRLRGAPLFAIRIESNRIYLEEGEREDSDVVVETSLHLLSLTIEASNSMLYLVKAWIIGKVKIRKGLLKAFKLMKAFKVLQLAFSED